MEQINSFPCVKCWQIYSEESGAYKGFICENCQNKQIKEYEQEIRKIIIDDYKQHILFIGNEILVENMSAVDFWEKLKMYCL